MGDSPGASTGSRDGHLGAALSGLLGAFIAGTAPFLDASPRELRVCLVVGIALVVSSAALAVAPWARIPRRLMLVCPALVIVAIGVLGLDTHALAQSFLTALSLVVLYVGITQPPGTTARIVPFLIADWWLAYPSHPTRVLVRLPLAVLVWVLIGELISRRSERVREETSHLRASASTDPLTGIGNRLALTDHLKHFSGRGVVLFIDLDHFKAYNDAHGHDAGDKVLVSFASTIAAALRGDDFIGRFGGEEFIVVLGEGANGEGVYQRLAQAWGDVGGPVTFSAGLAQRRSGESPSTTMARADAALYRAKQAGRNQLAIDPPAVDAPSVDVTIDAISPQAPHGAPAPLLQFPPQRTDEINYTGTTSSSHRF